MPNEIDFIKCIVEEAAFKYLDKGSAEVPAGEAWTLGHTIVSIRREQISFLKSRGIYCEPESFGIATTLDAGDYPDVDSDIVKFRKKGIIGRGAKIGVIDNGYNGVFVPADFSVDYTGTDLFGEHGCQTSSVIKSVIGHANGCELHIIKIIRYPDGFISESAFLSGLNYALVNNLDAVSMSFEFNAPTVPIIDALTALAANGCIPFASSGNSPTPAIISFPASHAKCVAVNAIKADGSEAYFSYLPVSGKGIDLAIGGWGQNVLLGNGSKFANFGTSYSCPYAASIFALYKEELGITNNRNILQHIYNRAKKQKNTLAFGKGIINS